MIGLAPRQTGKSIIRVLACLHERVDHLKASDVLAVNCRGKTIHTYIHLLHSALTSTDKGWMAVNGQCLGSLVSLFRNTTLSDEKDSLSVCTDLTSSLD